MNGSGNERQARIVVGVDGSEGSKHALRWAARQAEFTGATLEAIITWQYPTFYGWVPPYPDDMDLAKLARRALTDALDEVFGPPGCRPTWSRGSRPRSWSRRRKAPSSWSSVAADTAASPMRCSARSAPTASIMPTAPSPSSGQPATPHRPLCLARSRTPPSERQSLAQTQRLGVLMMLGSLGLPRLRWQRG